MKKKRIKNILNNFDKILVFLARHSSLSFFLVISLVVILTNILFYKYYALNQKILPAMRQEQPALNKQNYNDLLKFWEEQDKKFQNFESKTYLDIFEAR